MKSIPIALQQHILQDVATLATCWLIELADGTNIRGTDHDQDIVITSPTGHAGTYYGAVNITASDVTSSSDMSVDNLEVSGALQQYVEMPDLTAARIESGAADHAPVTVFICNWQAPDDGQVIMRRGYLGEFTRDTNGAYRTEVRGLTQQLSQTIGGTFGTRCSVKRFGDAQCKYPVEALRATGVVTEVISRQEFDTTIGYPDNPASVNIRFWDEFPADVEVGDAFTLVPGCDRLHTTCQLVYNNLINFRGYGLFIPGIDALTKSPEGGIGSVSQAQLEGALQDYVDAGILKGIQELKTSTGGGGPPPIRPPVTVPTPLQRMTGGEIDFTSGANVGFLRQIKMATLSED